MITIPTIAYRKADGDSSIPNAVLPRHHAECQLTYWMHGLQDALSVLTEVSVGRSSNGEHSDFGRWYVGRRLLWIAAWVSLPSDQMRSLLLNSPREVSHDRVRTDDRSS